MVKKFNEFLNTDIYIDSIVELIETIENDFPNTSELYFVQNHPN